MRDRLERLAAPVPGREDRLTHLEVLPARAAAARRLAGRGPTRTWSRRSPRGGVDRPWRHQVEAAEAASAGQHVVLATGTASGKSLGYQLPGADRDPRGAAAPRGQRGATVLYLAPTKALAQDQLRRGRAGSGSTCGPPPTTATAAPSERDWTRDHAEYVLTNPDMLHRSLLPGHAALGARSSASLRYVVVDECHHYRGVFGAHVAQVLRRLRRVCAAYGAAPDVRARLGHGRRARRSRPAGSPACRCGAVTDDALAARRGGARRSGSRR